MIADLVEPELGQPVNVLAYQVECCDGPLDFVQSGVLAQTEGRMVVHCPRCNTAWMAMTFWRKVAKLRTRPRAQKPEAEEDAA